MLRIAEFINPTPSPLWKLAKQAGVRSRGRRPAVRHRCRPARRRGTSRPCARLKQRYEDGGFELAVIEARPPLNKAKRGLPGRDEEIDDGLHAAREHGQARHPGLVLRVDDRLQLGAHQHGDALARRLGGDQLRRADVPGGPDRTGRRSARRSSGTNLEYFLERVLPVAEKAGVKLSMHPDDPPLSPIRGVGRIMRSDRQLPAPRRHGAEPAQHHHALPGQFHPDDRRPAGGRSASSATRSPSSTSATCAARRRGSRRPGTTRARPTCWPACGLPRHRLRRRAAARPRADRRGRQQRDAGYSAFGRLYAIGYIRGLQRGRLCGEGTGMKIALTGGSGGIGTRHHRGGAGARPQHRQHRPRRAGEATATGRARSSRPIRATTTRWSRPSPAATR